MKALSLIQPWSSLVAEGIKTVESRSWNTHYRGPLAIAASASIPTDIRHRVLGHRIRGRYNSYGQGDARILNALYAAGYEDAGVPDGKPLPLGCVVATCTLVDCVPTDRITFGEADGWRDGRRCLVLLPRERPFGDYAPGRFAWLMSDVVKIDPPVPVKGRQGLWEWSPPADAARGPYPTRY